MNIKIYYLAFLKKYHYSIVFQLSKNTFHFRTPCNLVDVEKPDEKANVSNENSKERIIKTEIEKKCDSTGSPNSNCTIPEPDIQASHIQRPWFSPMKLVRFPSLVGGNV